MEPENDKTDIAEELKARFLQLPKVLQEAITSTHVETRLRELSESHKLHLDQWQKLENEVMLALYGFQKVERLEENIKNEVGVSAETASLLAGDIAESIFLPIRAELERELERPGADEKKASAVEEMREGVLAEKKLVDDKMAAQALQPVTQASTPPPPQITEKSIRAPTSS